MTAQVVSLSDARQALEPHMTGAAQCVGCHHRFVAVAPVGTWALDCPSCGLPKGHFVNPVLAGTTSWTCKCGNDLFRIKPPGEVYCANCAAPQTGWFE